jgi:hydrogenase maturation protease
MNSLVIGYGNTLRNDDGAGQIVAEKVANWELTNLRVVAVHQLTPELAADIAEVEQVIFVDAYPASNNQTIKTYSLETLSQITIRSHTNDPRVLLSLTQTLYNCCPQAWLITIPGENFNLGECLSPMTQNGITNALTQIKSLLSEHFQ